VFGTNARDVPAVGMKRIPLTQGQFALVDDEDFDGVNSFVWFAKWNRCTKSFYAARNSVANSASARSVIRMHREILHAMKDSKVDHVNHDTLDNRRDNLRYCTHQQNARNMRLNIRNTSGFKGVKRSGSNWQSSIKVDGITLHLGSFLRLEDAAAAYDEAALKHFGEFALTNEMLRTLPELAHRRKETNASPRRMRTSNYPVAVLSPEQISLRNIVRVPVSCATDWYTCSALLQSGCGKYHIGLLRSHNRPRRCKKCMMDNASTHILPARAALKRGKDGY
jgi:hypothetical protein